MARPLLEELLDWLRIPSVSTGPQRDPEALRRAAGWVCERIEAAGGQVALVETARDPVVVGELRSARGDAPTVLAYGHYDVQDVGDPAAWKTPPFEPDVRDGRVYARGAADDKGNFLPLLHVACELAERGELPLHVRFLVEGEEESGGDSAARLIEADERGASCALIFDSLMVDERTPSLAVGARGVVVAQVEVRTGERDLHSGLYGGAAMNAANVLTAMLAAVLPDAEGRARPELRRGVEEPSAEERAGWTSLPRGADVLNAAGARPLAPGAEAELYERTGADTSLDVNEVVAGEPRTIVPCAARATVSARLAPGQRSDEVSETLVRLLSEAAPEDAAVRISVERADPAAVDPASLPLRLAADALERACSKRPAIVRLGGTLPVLAAFSRRGIPAILTGFVLPGDNIHSPDESFRLEALDLGQRSARELYSALAEGLGAAV